MDLCAAVAVWGEAGGVGSGERDLAGPQMWGAHLLPSSCPLLFMAEKSCVVQTGHVLVAQSAGSGRGVVPAQVSWGHTSHLLSHSAASLLWGAASPAGAAETPAPAPPRPGLRLPGPLVSAEEPSPWGSEGPAAQHILLLECPQILGI